MPSYIFSRSQYYILGTLIRTSKIISITCVSHVGPVKRKQMNDNNLWSFIKVL